MTKNPKRDDKPAILPTEIPFGAAWKLMPWNRLAMVIESGTITVNKGKKTERVWTVNMEIAGRALLLYTDLPHPDHPSSNAHYAIELLQPAKELAEMLFKLEIPPREKVKK